MKKPICARWPTRSGAKFETLDGIPRALCPVNDERLIESTAAGLLPLAIDDELFLLVAPRGLAARRITGMIGDNPALAHRFRFTSAERLIRFALRYCGKAIAARATGELRQAWPVLSAAPPRWRAKLFPIAVGALLTLAAAVLAPGAAVLTLEVMLAAMFLAWLALRLTGALVKWRASELLPGPADDALPVYTVIAALYHEATSVGELLTAIERL